MRMLDRSSAKSWLVQQGVPLSRIAGVMAGFNLEKPLYLHDFWPGDVLLQYVRNPSAADLDVGAGNWFALRGATMSGLAIHGDLAGRRSTSFKVVAPFATLEGTVGAFDKGKIPGVGGVGGQTQVFVPQSLRARLVSAG